MLLPVAALAGGAWWAVRTKLLNALLFFPERAIFETPRAAGLEYGDVEFPTEDGERLHGWWIPASRSPALAHVLHFHGNAGNIAGRIDEARLLAETGLDVFLFDYRGYGRSSGEASEEGTYRDARAAREALLRQPGVEEGRIVYLGESLGGAVALALALESPPRGIILRSTFTSIRHMARLHYPVVPAFLVPDAYPSLARIGGLKCPLLVVHGDRDDIVPLSHAEALFAAAPEPKQLRRVAGSGHNDLVFVAGKAYAELVAAWVRDLGPPGPSALAER